MFEAIINPIAIIISLCTTTGILLHETKIDKVASMTVLSPVPVVSMTAEESAHKLEGQPHTHVEKASPKRVSKDLTSPQPRIAPRRDEKYRLQKKVSRGFHAFDGYHLPELANDGQLGF